jgi:uncharacterized membrane protein HdeD (DUF308 family)
MAARRAGVVTFAGVLFIVAGLFTLFDGIIALTRPEQLYAGENVFIVKDFDAWGIALIIGGGLQALVGFGILTGSRAAQVVGVLLASLGFIAHLAYFRHYPAWAVTVMALDLIVIYALTVYSDEFGRRAGRRR